MKVAHIFDAIYPYEQSGVAKYIYLKAQEEVSEGHDIHIYGFKYWEGVAIRKEKNVTYHGILPPFNVYSPKGKRSLKGLFSFCFYLACDLLKADYDVVYCHGVPYLPIFICFFMKFWKKHNLIVVWHEVFGKYWFHFHPLLGTIGYLIEKTALFLPIKHAAISTFVFEKLPHKRGILLKAHIDWASIQRATPLNNKIYDISYVGRFVDYKQVHLLLEALEFLKLENIFPKTLLMGEGPLKNKIEKMKEEKKLFNIEMLDCVQDVYPYLKSTKLFVLPSKREGLSFVTLEAQACGAKAIVINAPLNAAKTLTPYVCENNSRALAQMIKKLLI